VEKYLSSNVTDEAALNRIKKYKAAASGAYAAALSPKAKADLQSFTDMTSVGDVSGVMKALFWVLTVLTFGVFYVIINAGVNGALNNDADSKKLVAALAVVAGVGTMIAFDEILTTFFELVPANAPAAPTPAAPAAGDKTAAPAKAADAAKTDKTPDPAPTPDKTPAAPTSILAALLASSGFTKAFTDSDVATPTALATALGNFGVTVKAKDGAPTEFSTEQKDSLKQLVVWSTNASKVALLKAEIKKEEGKADKEMRKTGFAAIKSDVKFTASGGDFVGKAKVDGAKKFENGNPLAAAIKAPNFVSAFGKEADAAHADDELGALVTACVNSVLGVAAVGEVTIDEAPYKLVATKKYNEVVVLFKGDSCGGNSFTTVLRTAVTSNGGAALSDEHLAAANAFLAAVLAFKKDLLAAVWAAAEADEGYKKARDAAKTGAAKSAFDVVTTKQGELGTAEGLLFPAVTAAAANPPAPTPKPGDAGNKGDGTK
jgi:hypothetical protein